MAHTYNTSSNLGFIHANPESRWLDPPPFAANHAAFKAMCMGIPGTEGGWYFLLHEMYGGSVPRILENLNNVQANLGNFPNEPPPGDYITLNFAPTPDDFPHFIQPHHDNVRVMLKYYPVFAQPSPEKMVQILPVTNPKGLKVSVILIEGGRSVVMEPYKPRDHRGKKGDGAYYVGVNNLLKLRFDDGSESRVFRIPPEDELNQDEPWRV